MRKNPTTCPALAYQTSAQWTAYFRRNSERLLEQPWHLGAEISDAERDAIATSLQEFQLGESSEGRHIISAARRYSETSGDRDYAEALCVFIAEEHRHARDLGRFLDLAGVPRASKAWPDTVFRWLRRRAGLETSIVVLVTAEIIAKVYYAALREATTSRLLRRLCDQILADEVAHVHFQTERLAVLRRGRPCWRIAAGRSVHRFLMFGTCFVVWHKHGKAMGAGGYGFRRFWGETWREMREALFRADPGCYRIAPAGTTDVSSHTPANWPNHTALLPPPAGSGA
jgi:hypothetical protein